VRAGRLALAGSLAIAGLASGARAARAAEDPFAWAPARAPEVVRGREAASRFGLLALYEITVEIDNVFASANRQALALAAQHLAELPGVRAVYGPSTLLDVSIDASGKTRARPVLARGASESEGEAARQRVVRRADALGWFVTENGRRARFLVDTDDWRRVAPGVTSALVSSGLGLASESETPFEARPLWPDPRRRNRWLPVELAAAWVLFALVASTRARIVFADRRRGRAIAGMVAVALGAAAPFVLVPVAGVAATGGLAALAAALVVALSRWRAPAPGFDRGTTPPSRALCAVAAAMVLGGAVAARRLRVTTRQWAAAPMFFVSVRADFDEPVVLREVRRLADFLRAEPGVANAWSAADLFTGLTLEGEESSRIPDDSEAVRRVLVQARNDPAVRLELASDHREGLVGVRFDDDPTVDHQSIVEDVERYIEVEMRRSLVHVDLDAAGTSPTTRAFGQGLLGLDARERVLRICDRSGRALGPAEALSIERVARQAATIPGAEPARLDLEVGDTVREVIARHPFPLPPAEAGRLTAAVVALGDGATEPAVEVALASAYGSRLPGPILRATAVNLSRRVAAVRRRLIARANFRDMLTGADLPTEGVLADEVRGATAEAMGPVVGIPVPRQDPAAFKLDAVPIGGAANDRALSAVWNRALRAGVACVAALLGILLIWVAGAAGTLWLPLALAPLALAVAPAALLGEPAGLPTISFFAGALAGGAALALAAAPARILARKAAEP
jgi:hypothetical protein